MANRRMFSKDITESDDFLELSLSAQALYFHIGMHADDYGYCGKVLVMRLTGCKSPVLDDLVSAGFIYLASDKVLFVTHWKENNQQRKDRKKASKYEDLYKLSTKCQPNVNQMSTNGCRSIGEYSIVEDSIGQVSIGNTSVGDNPKPAKDKKKKTVDDKTELPEWLNKTAWLEFEQHRKDIKAKLTPLAITKLFNILEKNKDYQQEIIDQSIQGGWKGLFPLKKGYTASKRPANFIEAPEGKYDNY